MKPHAIRIMLATTTIAGLLTIASPAQADPCDVNVKDIVVIDLINCG